MVSKTVESAQSRVEGYNFDIRKRVVEYDDVINKQRATIYAERDKVLHNEDLSQTLLAFVEQELELAVDAHLGESTADWDLDGLAEALRALGLRDEGLDPEALAELGTQSAILEQTLDAAAAQLEEREAALGEETWALVERAVLLRAIDTLWVEHLTELDDFRRGVGLRGYGGTDPLVEFKREAFKLYEELRGFIRHQVASTIFRVSVQRRPVPAQEPTEMPTLTPDQLASLKSGSGALAVAGPRAAAGYAMGGSVTSSSGATATAELAPLPSSTTPRTLRLQHGDEAVGVAPGARPDQPPQASRIGRNDPCWCGSGKKFKRCHGG
jgi:preprotein translocase subunit SecA